MSRPGRLLAGLLGMGLWLGCQGAEPEVSGGASSQQTGGVGESATTDASSGADTAASASAGGTTSSAGSSDAAPGADVASLFPTSESELLGKPAPGFDLEMRSGEKLSLESLKGQVVVVNFWATWCPPCIEELPSLERLRRQLKGSPVEILGVSVDEGWKPVEELLLKHPVGFKILLDIGRGVPTRYGTSKFPETFIVDKQGVVVRKLIGAQVWDRGDFVSYLRDLSRK